MSQHGTKMRPDFSAEPGFRELGRSEEPDGRASAQVFERLRLLWYERRIIARMTLCGLALATLVAFLLPKQYQSTLQLMPPDSQSSSASSIDTSWLATSVKRSAGRQARAVVARCLRTRDSPKTQSRSVPSSRR